MDYSLLIANVPTITRDIYLVLLISLTIATIAALVVVYIVRKLKENEVLKKEFITIVAHKFRTPLTQSRWLTESLMADEQDSFKKQSLEEMGKVTAGLINLTGTLIELTESDTASKTSYTFERVPLCQFVRGVGESLKKGFKEKNIFFAVQCPTEEVYAKVDKSRMEFVLQTLLNNALTYSPPGRNVDVLVTHGGGKAVISVTDHGIGIKREDISHIFTKFYRTDIAQRTDTEGFGVGLYLAKSVVRRHKGKLEVYSEGLNMGTTFTVTLKEVR